MPESFYPSQKRSRHPTMFLAIDMWGIEGEYADGNWHVLLHRFAVDWSQKHPEQATATLWSSVQPCSIFTNGSSCYIAGSAHLPDAFFQQLEVFLRAAFGDCARIGGEIQVNVDEWRVYLHFESGGIWEKYNGYEWRALEL